MSRQGSRIIFMCCIFLIYFSGRFVQLYCDTASLGTNAPTWGVKSTQFSHIPNIFAVNLLSKAGKIPSLSIYKLLLINQSQIFDKFLVFFDSFLDVHIPGKCYWYWTCSSSSFKFSPIFVSAVTVILGCFCFWVGFWPGLPKMGYTRKNPNSGGSWEHGISRGIEERACKNSSGQLKKKWNFQGCIK